MKAVNPPARLRNAENVTVSVITEGLLNVLTKEEILDLIAYLHTAGNPEDKAFTASPLPGGDLGGLLDSLMVHAIRSLMVEKSFRERASSPFFTASRVTGVTQRHCAV